MPDTDDRTATSEKDFREKLFEDFNDVFADIINVLIFNGDDMVSEDALESGMARSAYKVSDKFSPQERDVKKYWKNGLVRIATFGLENQTGMDCDFIFRSGETSPLCSVVPISKYAYPAILYIVRSFSEL